MNTNSQYSKGNDTQEMFKTVFKNVVYPKDVQDKVDEIKARKLKGE